MQKVFIELRFLLTFNWWCLEGKSALDKNILLLEVDQTTRQFKENNIHSLLPSYLILYATRNCMGSSLFFSNRTRDFEGKEF
jgi:hypothetical protein